MEKDSMSRQEVTRADAARLDHAADYYERCVRQREDAVQARGIVLELATVAFMTVSHLEGRDSPVPARQPFAVMTARRLIIVTPREDADPLLTIVDREGGFVDLQA
jgi:hypothetical protein